MYGECLDATFPRTLFHVMLSASSGDYMLDDLKTHVVDAIVGDARQT